eukprot:TRINITY_DN3098_c0_g1_i1.p1 TRINITY_DN3098_c0_g1~~TRINITY_DN3098_c0_g1_i1.p1  ORF type:complete len:272 (+),score=49.24 TRINITY_DN3098_c0_g1_i1:52-867(+)
MDCSTSPLIPNNAELSDGYIFIGNLSSSSSTVGEYSIGSSDISEESVIEISDECSKDVVVLDDDYTKTLNQLEQERKSNNLLPCGRKMQLQQGYFTSKSIRDEHCHRLYEISSTRDLPFDDPDIYNQFLKIEEVVAIMEYIFHFRARPGLSNSVKFSEDFSVGKVTIQTWELLIKKLQPHECRTENTDGESYQYRYMDFNQSKKPFPALVNDYWWNVKNIMSTMGGDTVLHNQVKQFCLRFCSGTGVVNMSFCYDSYVYNNKTNKWEYWIM